MENMKNTFIKFLEEKGVLEEYKTNLANNMGSDGFADFKAWIKSTNPSDYILSAFLWGYASEDVDSSEEEKWCAINYDWQSLIDKKGGTK